jgi:hypothetical protein
MPTPAERARDDEFWRQKRVDRLNEIKRKENVTELLDWIYYNFREDCEFLENALTDNYIDAKLYKRLDKAITVQKAGFKLMKRALKSYKTAQHRIRDDAGMFAAVAD